MTAGKPVADRNDRIPTSAADIVALDFDGVICNSVDEAAAAGWKGAARLWPNRFRGVVPAEIIKCFRHIRPVMETGYESILLVRLLQEGCAMEKILSDPRDLFATLIHDHRLSKDLLVRVFGQIRDAWILSDLQGWLAMHEYYEGTVEAINQSHGPVYIITTKERRFATALCRAADLQVSEERIFGLESGTKCQVLAELSKRHESARIHFVEDRIQTISLISHQAGFHVQFYLAGWGYNTLDDRETADKMPNLEILSLSQFPRFLEMPHIFPCKKE